MEEQLKQQIIKIISNHLGVPEDHITEEKRFIDDLGADSLDTVELVLAIEDEFGIEVDDETAEGMSSVGLAIQAIERLKSS